MEMLDAADRNGIPVGVLSAAQESVLHRDIVHLGLTGRFAFVIGGISSKRDALAVLVAISGRVVYVGDTEFDLTEARAAGAETIGFSGGYRPEAALRAAGAEWHVSDLSQAAAILSQITV